MRFLQTDPWVDVTSVHFNSKKVYEDEIFSRQDILQFFSGESKDYKYSKSPQNRIGKPVNNHAQAGQLNHVQADQLNHIQVIQLNHVQARQQAKTSCAYLQLIFLNA